MLNNLDENTYSLNQYHNAQDAAQIYWDNSKPEKCQDVIDFGKKLMETDYRTSLEFSWVFNEFLNEETVWTVEEFEESLDNWILGYKPSSDLESECLWAIALAALEGASHILFDVELDELCTWSQGENNVKIMVRELLGIK